MVYYVMNLVCVPLFAFCCLAHVIMKKEVPHVELYILINTMLGYANFSFCLLDELKRYMLYNHYYIGDFVVFVIFRVYDIVQHHELVFFAVL